MRPVQAGAVRATPVALWFDNPGYVVVTKTDGTANS
jgi:hypothetical protein